MVPDWLGMKIMADYFDPEVVKTRLAPLSDVVGGLSEASLRAPLREEAVKVYRFCFTRLMDEKGVEVPDDLRLDKLDAEEERALLDIRNHLFNYRNRKGIMKVLLRN